MGIQRSAVAVCDRCGEEAQFEHGGWDGTMQENGITVRLASPETAENIGVSFPPHDWQWLKLSNVISDKPLFRRLLCGSCVVHVENFVDLGGK